MNEESINNNSEPDRYIVSVDTARATSSLSQEEILNMETNGFLDMDQLDNLSREMDLILSKTKIKMTEIKEEVIEVPKDVVIQLEEKPIEPLFIKNKFNINDFELVSEFDQENDLYTNVVDYNRSLLRGLSYDKLNKSKEKAIGKLYQISNEGFNKFLVELKVCTRDYITSGVNIYDNSKSNYNFFYITSIHNETLYIKNKYHNFTVDIRDVNIYKIRDNDSINIINNINNDFLSINPKCDINKYLKFKNPNLYQALIEVFEDKQWGVFFNNDESYTINIHFPVINITNSNNRKHTIFDIIVKLRFTKNNQYLQFLATKATILEKEIINQDYCYIHSHIQKLNKSNITNPENAEIAFCLGDGTPISFQHKLLTNLKDKVTFENYMGFLLSIKPYLEWESLEGVPYHKISDLIDYNKWVPANINDLYTNLINKIKTYLSNHNSTTIINNLNLNFDEGKNFKLFSSRKEIKILIKNIDIVYKMFNFSSSFRELEECKLKFVNGQYYKESNSISVSQREKLNSFKQSVKDKKIYINNNYFLPVVVKADTDDFSKVEKTIPIEIINNLNEDLSHILNSM